MSHSNVAALPRRRTRKVTIASVVTAMLLSVFASLLGPVQSASAEDNNPTFRIGTDGKDGYWGFINAIRARVADGSTNRVPWTNNRVDHTQADNRSRGHAGFFEVDIHAWGGGPNDYVRLRLRASDLYIVGWWNRHNEYVTAVPADQAGPRDRWQNGAYRDATRIFRGYLAEDYPSLESIAGRRQDITFNRSNLNSAVWNLLNASEVDSKHYKAERYSQASAFLAMTQFVAEATRFRGISDLMAQAAAGSDIRLGDNLVGQENNWGRLSARFNRLRERESLPSTDSNFQSSDPQPLTGWGVDWQGHIRSWVLWTAANYADFVLNTAKGH